MPDDRSRPTPQQGGSQNQQDHPTLDLEPSPTPYAYAWHAYVAAGWAGPIPMARTWKGQPSDGKFPPVAGFTGRRNAGTWPTVEQMHEWAVDWGRWGNIALRPPDDVIGLDCDAYGDKHGDQTMGECVRRWGNLPATWTSGNRPDDLASRISWFRVPAGLAWPGKLPGGDVEIIQHGHRYAIVWPSVHPSGRTYFWARPGDGMVVDGIIPSKLELAHLPAAWIAGLTEGKTVDHRPHQVQQHGGVVCDDMMGDARSWLTDGAPCPAVTKALDGFDGASRHDSMLQLQLRLLRLGEQGHRGVLAALDTLESMFVGAVAGSRTPGQAEDEWQRALNAVPELILRKGLTPADRRGCCTMPLPSLAQLLRRFQREEVSS